jgi:glycosyltransferase involved in cell wall biosynthesis
MNEEIQVSIICLVYNHKKYLRKCLEGFVMQKTCFKFEVLIHDDASTDGSQDIIKEYEEKYPDIIKPIYQTENQYSKNKPIIGVHLYPKAKGKYLAFCEGDDYWTDPLKLQKQFDILEKNRNCSISTHLVLCINENGSINKKRIPEKVIEEGIITGKDFFELISKHSSYPFQTTSYFVRREVADSMYKSSLDYLYKGGAADFKILLTSFLHGNMYYLDHPMSNYRLFSKGSWTSRMDDPSLNREYINKLNDTLLSYDKYTDLKYHNQIMYLINKREFRLLMANHKYRKCLNTKYHVYFRKLSIKEKIYIIIHSIIERHKYE